MVKDIAKKINEKYGKLVIAPLKEFLEKNKKLTIFDAANGLN